MSAVNLAPLAQVPIPPHIAALPKADLHIHQEQTMRLGRVLASSEQRPAYDWSGWVRRMMAEEASGVARLAHTAAVRASFFTHRSRDALLAQLDR